MKSRIISFSLLCTAIFLIGFTSCTKEEIVETENAVSTSLDEEELILDYRGGGQFGIRSRCFRLVFPLSVAYPDGTTVVAEDARELFSIYKDWRQNNPDATDGPSLVYPIQVKLRNGSIVVVDNRDDLIALKADCRMLRDSIRQHNGCFSLIYPVFIDFPDGSSAQALSRAELHQLVKDWKEANPDATDRPMLGFPLSVLLRDSSTLVLTTSAELDSLKQSCRRGGHGGHTNRPTFLLDLGCHTLLYPVTLDYPDGSILTVNDKLEHIQALRTYKQDNPDATDYPEVAFPFDIKQKRTGDIITINNQDDLDTAIDDCG